jgi:hypothetical protein
MPKFWGYISWCRQITCMFLVLFTYNNISFQFVYVFLIFEYDAVIVFL